MSLFSAQWLSLREPYDIRARNRQVMAALVAASQPALGVVDLACGSGASLRALGPLLPKPQDWRLVDNDLGLLARAAGLRLDGAHVDVVPLDLVHDLEAALDGPVHLVTTSALLDLVSEEWLDRLVTEVAARRLAFYASLTYDGRIELDPADDFDPSLVEAVKSHQRRDHGFGLALSGAAAALAVDRFRAVGYLVTDGQSDRTIPPGDDEMLMAVLSNWTDAARLSARLARADIDRWFARRRDAVSRRALTIRIGHVDFFATPMRAR